jgi:hypothetical protein
MEKDNVLSLATPVAESSAPWSVLEELVRSGARRILQEALAQSGRIFSPASIAQTARRDLGQKACPPLGKLMLLRQEKRNGSLVGGRHHFFETTSFKATISRA